MSQQIQILMDQFRITICLYALALRAFLRAFLRALRILHQHATLLRFFFSHFRTNYIIFSSSTLWRESDMFVPRHTTNFSSTLFLVYVLYLTNKFSFLPRKNEFKDNTNSLFIWIWNVLKRLRKFIYIFHTLGLFPKTTICLQKI